ncbi:hypothetical protein CapIbe_007601 [Capra ibex]
MSPRRDSSEAALTRSTSVRLPARSVKIGLKLEQYLSAIQRSESVRSWWARAEGPASSHKENLQLSGVEKSRLNLWISRTQESAQQGPQNQETQLESEAGKRPQWRKKPEPPLGAEV